MMMNIIFTDIYSNKQKENNFYWMYCLTKAEIPPDLNNAPNPFYYINETKSRAGTPTEMGRLLLTGWYYNIENFTLDVCNSIYHAFLKKIDTAKPFNDTEFKEAVKHIRENVIYYYQNENELKAYLEHLFERELTPKQYKQEYYIEYLTGILNEYGISYFTEDEYKKELKECGLCR